MTILKFKCEMLSDVILNQKAATEGPNQTLDFIPGSNFLGIVAGQLYPELGMCSDTLSLFHCKKVRFGDAHPAHGENRSLRVPASLYFAKGEKEDERTHYIHHAITPDISKEINEKKIQLKQERSGFVDFIGADNSKPATRLKVQTNFAIKSAYDQKTRRSKDSQMYGYQSMEKGRVFYFSVEIEESINEKANDIINALVGTKHIGRSRSAQYGLVEISLCDGFQEVQSAEKADNTTIIVYAESRLIFLDDYGLPTFQPSVEQLVGKDSCMEIDWGKSQIRTFKYAPYNYARRCFDTDRCGIEKGSVIVLSREKEASVKELNLPRWVGSYQNEGFGKVIFNPPFFNADKAKLAYNIKTEGPTELKQKCVNPNTLLTRYVIARQQKDKQIGEIYQKVNDWVNSHSKAFNGKTFASQWGNIRNIAMMCSDNVELCEKLFVYNNQKKTGGYLVHGVAAEKWQSHVKNIDFNKIKSEQITPFMKFVYDNSPEHVVNLASVMQKKCSENKNDGGKTK